MFASRQQRFRALDPQIEHVTMRRDSERFVKEPRKMRRAIARTTGEVFEAKRIVQMRMHIIDDTLCTRRRQAACRHTRRAHAPAMMAHGQGGHRLFAASDKRTSRRKAPR